MVAPAEALLIFVLPLSFVAAVMYAIMKQRRRGVR